MTTSTQPTPVRPPLPRLTAVTGMILFNQHGVMVMTYTAKRLLADRPAV